ncbi:MAG: hypothetical protein ACJAY7_000237 [Pseudohongiellaceae bacterium]|jgi:hypothetical protein
MGAIEKSIKQSILEVLMRPFSFSSVVDLCATELLLDVLS